NVSPPVRGKSPTSSATIEPPPTVNSMGHCVPPSRSSLTETPRLWILCSLLTITASGRVLAARRSLGGNRGTLLCRRVLVLQLAALPNPHGRVVASRALGRRRRLDLPYA